MNKVTRKILLLVVICFFSFSSAPAQITEILKRMDNHSKSLKSLEGNLQINQFTASTGEKLTKKGNFKFLSDTANYYLRIDSDNEVFAITQNQYLLYLPKQETVFIPNLKSAYNGSVTDSQKNMFMLFSLLSKEKLKSNYNIKYFGEEKTINNLDTLFLEFTPRKATTFKKIMLWVDTNGMVVQSKITDNESNVIETSLDNFKKNTAIKTSDFNIVLPKDTKIFKN